MIEYVLIFAFDERGAVLLRHKSARGGRWSGLFGEVTEDDRNNTTQHAARRRFFHEAGLVLVADRFNCGLRVDSPDGDVVHVLWVDLTRDESLKVYLGERKDDTEYNRWWDIDLLNHGTNDDKVGLVDGGILRAGQPIPDGGIFVEGTYELIQLIRVIKHQWEAP